MSFEHCHRFYHRFNSSSVGRVIATYSVHYSPQVISHRTSICEYIIYSFLWTNLRVPALEYSWLSKDSQVNYSRWYASTYLRVQSSNTVLFLKLTCSTLQSAVILDSSIILIRISLQRSLSNLCSLKLTSLCERTKHLHVKARHCDAYVTFKYIL